MTKDGIMTTKESIEKDNGSQDSKKYDVNGLTSCSKTDQKCDIEKATGLRKVCIQKYILDVSNPLSTNYRNALARDPTLYKGSEIYSCYP